MDDKTRKLMFSSENPDIGTPQNIFDKIQKEHGVTIDLCADANNTKCKNYISEEMDIFKTYWDENAFMNPPYNKPEKPCKKKCKKKKCQKRGCHTTEYVPGQIDFVKRVNKVVRQNKKKTVCLLPARTDTALFHTYIWDTKKKQFKNGVSVDFLEGRITFEGMKDPAPFPSMVVVFDGSMMH